MRPRGPGRVISSLLSFAGALARGVAGVAASIVGSAGLGSCRRFGDLGGGRRGLRRPRWRPTRYAALGRLFDRRRGWRRRFLGRRRRWRDRRRDRRRRDSFGRRAGTDDRADDRQFGAPRRLVRIERIGCRDDLGGLARARRFGIGRCPDRQSRCRSVLKRPFGAHGRRDGVIRRSRLQRRRGRDRGGLGFDHRQRSEIDGGRRRWRLRGFRARVRDRRRCGRRRGVGRRVRLGPGLAGTETVDEAPEKPPVRRRRLRRRFLGTRHGRRFGEHRHRCGPVRRRSRLQRRRGRDRGDLGVDRRQWFEVHVGRRRSGDAVRRWLRLPGLRPRPTARQAKALHRTACPPRTPPLRNRDCR